jgi:hypothetical protein
MDMTFTCDDKETLIAYLYGELDAPASRAVQEHLAHCAACAREVSGLGDVRAELGAWMAPEANLDFAVVRKSEAPSNVLRPARWWNTVPAWAQAAAAILVLAAGASIANLQIKSGPDGFSVTTGWMQPAAPAASERIDAAAVDARVEQALAAVQQQLRSEIRATRDQVVPVAARTENSTADDVTIRRVQQLISDAEQRHSRELAQRFVDFTRDMNMQRRADLMQISNSLSSFSGDYDRRLLQQRQMINNVIRVSTVPQQ